MTDVVTRPDVSAGDDAVARATTAVSGSASDAITPDATATGAGELQWAPAPEKRRRRWPLALWIGIPAAALIAGGWWAGMSLIAPGVSVAGVAVGGLTPDAAAARIAETVAATGVEFTVGSTSATITGADLGATIDAEGLAAQALGDHPLWQVGGWFPEPAPVAPVIDPDAAETAIAEALSGVWVDPVNASIAFDAASASYVVTPGIAGEGLTVDSVADAYVAHLHDGSGDTPARVTADLATLEPRITTAVAEAKAAELNAMLATAGFYVGAERTVPLDPAFTAGWLTIVPSPADGTIEVTADTAAIQASVDSLQPLIDRAPVNGAQVINNAGKVLRVETAGQDGRVLGDTSGVADAFATQLAAGNGVYELPVQVTVAETVSVVRLLEVDLSEQRLYLKENGQTIDSWLISSGKSGWRTNTGHFTVNYKIRMQDMTGIDYFQPDVEWVMYFSGDQAFHAVYWRDIWGVPMSHGCVGMPTSLAKQIYQWADVGTDVYIHD